MTFLELAKRCDEYDEKDITLNRDILLAFFPGSTIAPLSYTTSLDAAMSLVPKDAEWAVYRVQYDNAMAIAAWVDILEEECFGDSPALALTTAALRSAHTRAKKAAE